VRIFQLIKRFYGNKQGLLQDALAVSLLAVVSLVASLWIFRETIHGLFLNRIPLAGDGLLTGLYIKAVEKVTYFSLLFQNVESNQFGWPGKLDFTSYPVGNTQEMFAIKIFMDLTGINDPSQIIHIFSILKVVPIAIAAFILARILGINRLISFGIGLIFSLNTFNLIRAEGHFFLALTWSLPLGIAAIFIAFKQVHKDLPRSGRDIGAVISLCSLSFLSGFYYTFFLIIFAITTLVYLVIFINLNAAKITFFGRVKNSLRLLSLPILVLILFILGLFIQTFPILVRSKRILNLTGLADRSSVESIIYAGTPETLFFDMYSFALRILKRPDLVAYLQSRISWEGSQVGALSGLILVGLLIALLLSGLLKLLRSHRVLDRSKFQLDSAGVFIFIMLPTSLLFYFVSPINFAVSQLLPQIRAWGRLSVVISLLTLILLGILFTQLKKTNQMTWVIAATLIVIPIVEINQFHISRPPSGALSDSARTQSTELKSSLEDLKAKYPRDCSIVNLPVYPFPEFDRPDDQNIDYGQLQIPILDSGYFRWSYSGIKATQNFAAWQPLISEFPPFTRASISDQVDYAKAVGACGSLIDRTYLTEVEKLDLEELTSNRDICASELTGSLFENRSRFVSISFQGNACKLANSKEFENMARESSVGKFLWRIDQSSPLEYKGSWQVFPYSSTINARLKTNSNNNGASLVLRIRIASIKSINDSKLNVCITHSNSSDIQCLDVISDAEGLAEVQIPQTLMSGKTERFTVSLTSNSENKVSSWGIQVGLEN